MSNKKVNPKDSPMHWTIFSRSYHSTLIFHDLPTFHQVRLPLFKDSVMHDVIFSRLNRYQMLKRVSQSFQGWNKTVSNDTTALSDSLMHATILPKSNHPTLPLIEKI